MKRMSRALVLFLVIVGMVLSLGVSADEVVFTSYFGHLHYANGDGTGVMDLWTAPEIYPMTPTAYWDSLGNLVVYFAGNDQTLQSGTDCDIFELYQGALSYPLTTGEGNFQPARSPDGTQIGFVSYVWENGVEVPKIFILDLVSMNVKRMNKEKGDQYDPDWGAGGLLFTSFSQEGFPQIRRCKPYAKSKVVLSPNTGGGVSDPSWLPDGTGFAFVDARDGTDYMHTNWDITVTRFGPNYKIASETRLTNSGILNYEDLEGKLFYFGPACSDTYVYIVSEVYNIGIGTRDVYRVPLIGGELENISNVMGMHDIYDIAVVK